jgi:DNA-3-methyladenine glycosylase
MQKYVKLSKDFYLRNSIIVAKELLGKILVHKKGRKTYSGIIAETEAYTGKNDPAAHSYKGKTPRNEVMFSDGGVCYVYFTYGNHYCVNVVAEAKDIPHAVLIRALEPLIGIKYMMKNRCTDNIYNLTNGPGKLTKAMEIDLSLNGEDLRGNKIFISEPFEQIKFKILKSKRIGITKNPDKLWRFHIKDNPFVSRININAIMKNK